jgi:hypothetical protein
MIVRAVASSRWPVVAGAVVLAGALLMAAGCANGQRSTGLDGGGGSVAGGGATMAGMPCGSAPFVVTPGPDDAPPTSAAPSPRPLPEDFIAVVARRCVFRTVTEPGDGEWQVQDEQEATSGLDPLLSALRQPSATPAKDICPAIGVLPLGLTLVDAGGATFVPAPPHDGCGLPLQAVMQAVQALPWKTVKVTKVARVRGQLEVDSGCSGEYKPTVAISAAERVGGSGKAGPIFGGAVPRTLTLCRYRLDATSTISMASGSGPLQMGKLDTVATLTGDPLARLVSALDAAPPVRDGCDRPQAPFVVLYGESGPGTGPGSGTAVELSGCYRAVGDDGHLRQLDAATVALLNG